MQSDPDDVIALLVQECGGHRAVDTAGHRNNYLCPRRAKIDFRAVIHIIHDAQYRLDRAFRKPVTIHVVGLITGQGASILPV